MKLFNKTIDRQLFKQYALGSDLSKQEVVVKIFNPTGNGTWFILNSDPQDPDYLWAIVDLGYGAEVGSVSRSELENYKGRFGLGFERDLGFDPINAEELYQGLRKGEYFADGGGLESFGEKIKDDKGLFYWKSKEDGKIRLSSENGTIYFLEFNTLPEAEAYVKKVNAKTSNFFSSTYAKGGNIENFSDNQQMIMNQNVEVEHHHEELEDILENEIPVPAWVVAKMETATQNLSDITHYLDGQKEIMEEELEGDNDDDDDDDDDEMSMQEIENKVVVEPIIVTAGNKTELTKNFTDDAFGNLKGFLKGFEGIDLREDYTFDYKDEQYEIEPIINSDENGVSNAVFSVFNGDGDEVGEITYSSDGGKQKFTANSELFVWNNTKFEDGGFMNNVYADGGEVTNEDYEQRLQYLKMIKNNERTAFGKYKIDKEIREINTILEHRVNLKKSYAKGGGVEKFKVGDKVKIKYISDNSRHNNKIGTITWLNEYNYYPNGDYSVIKKKTQGIITYEDGSEEGVSDFYAKGSGITSPVKKVSFSDGGYFDGAIPKTSSYMSNYAKGGEMNIKDLTNIEVYDEVKSKVGNSVWEQNALNILRNESLKNPNSKFNPTGDSEKLTKYLSYGDSFAKGGEIAKAEILGLKRNIMGTTDIEMKITGMRKPQDFIVYPIGADDAGNVIKIQSDTRIGQINLVKGVGVMSQSHQGGAYFVHLQMDKLTSFELSEKDLKDLKAFINKTSGDNVGSSIIKSDNSGASRIFAKGGQIPDWLFIGVYPNAYIFADKRIDNNGYYHEIGRIVFNPFQIRIFDNSSKYASAIEVINKEAKELEKQGYVEISATGQRVDIKKMSNGGSFMSNVYAKGGSVKKDWWQTVVNPNENFHNYDNRKPIDWEVDDFKEWVVSNSDLDGNVDKEVLDVVKMPKSKLTVEYLNKNGSGKNNNDYYKKYGNWQSALYDVFTQIKKDYLFKKERKYILKSDIKTVTVKRKGKEVTYNGSDVLNGAYVLAKGGDMTSKANYVGKNDVVEVELKDGSKVKPVNGYWIKKGAEPIASKQEFTSKDLPKDGSEIKITAPKLGNFPEIDLILKYDSKNFRFDIYEDGVKKDVIGEKEVLNNLNSGIYMLSNKSTPTPSAKSETKVGETYIRKDMRNNWKAETNVDDFNGYDWRVSTIKTYSGKLISSAQGGKTEPTETKGYEIFKYTMYEDPNYTLEVSTPKRLTEKLVSEQHDKALAKFKKFMETGMFKGGGKISKFDKLSAKVAKNYEGKPVKSEYQEEYGKYYSKEEAQEVGDKVAGKIKAMQTVKKQMGGKTEKKENGGRISMKLANELAKEIRKDGESWNDAKKRAFAQLKK